MNILEGQILQHKLLAEYWMAMATTGLVKKRQVFHGTQGKEFTDEEKVEDAMKIAMNHICLIGEMVDKLPPLGE